MATSGSSATVPPVAGLLVPDAYQVPNYADSHAVLNDSLKRVEIPSIFQPYRNEQTQSVEALRPPALPKLDDTDLSAIMRQENELQRRREIIEQDPVYQFVVEVSSLTNTQLQPLAATAGQFFGGQSRPTPTLPSNAASQISSPYLPDVNTTPGLLGRTTPLSSFTQPQYRSTAPLAQNAFTGGLVQPSMRAAAAGGQPGIAQMSYVDMLRSDDDSLRALGESIYRSLQIQEAQIYAKRIEATGLVVFNPNIDTAARHAFNEIIRIPGHKLTGCPGYMWLVRSSELSTSFAAVVAAHINHTNGGTAPRRDVLNSQFETSLATYKVARDQLYREAAWVGGRVVRYEAARHRGSLVRSDLYNKPPVFYSVTDVQRYRFVPSPESALTRFK